MKQAKNLTALLLTVLLAFGMVAVVPVTVSAADDRPVEPIECEEISTVEDLYMINFDLADNYKLMNDIDLSEATAEGGDWDYVGNGWEPIGSKGIYDNSTPFTGTFDGNGFEIKGLRIDYKTKPGGTGDAYIGSTEKLEITRKQEKNKVYKRFLCIYNTPKYGISVKNHTFWGR